MDGVRQRELAFRRSPTLILHWAEGSLLLQNYAVPCSVPAHPAVVDLLDQFSTWKSLDDYLIAQPPASAESCERLVAELHRHRFLWRSDDALLPAETAMEAWDKWNPSAGLFHMATKNTDSSTSEAFVPHLVEKQETQPRPATAKRYDDAPSRRTCPNLDSRENFPRCCASGAPGVTSAAAPIDLSSLSTLLHLVIALFNAGPRPPVKAASRSKRPLPEAPVTRWRPTSSCVMSPARARHLPLRRRRPSAGTA